MMREFNEVAFSLSEGEISDPFKTKQATISFLEKIRGQEYDEHILLRPEISKKEIDLLKKELIQ